MLTRNFSRGSGGGSVGPQGPAGTNGVDGNSLAQFDFYTATNPSYQMAGGVRYIPLTQGNTDTIEMQCCAPLTGTAEVVLVYAMSVANGGDVELYLDRRVSGDTDDLDAAVTAGAEFVITPGSVTTRLSVTSSDDASLSFAVTEGDLVYLKLGRTADAEDTHTGDFRLMRAYMKVVP